MSPVHHRPPAREAGPELLVLQAWEGHVAWLLTHTGRWPRSARFGLASRVQDRALEVAEALVVARFDRAARPAKLAEVNLALERVGRV